MFSFITLSPGCIKQVLNKNLFSESMNKPITSPLPSFVFKADNRFLLFPRFLDSEPREKYRQGVE